MEEELEIDYKAMLGRICRIYISQNSRRITRVGILKVNHAKRITLLNVYSGDRYKIPKDTILGIERVI